MWRLATLAVVAALISPTVVSGQNYSFGDWARVHNDQLLCEMDPRPKRTL
jgi:hypothetical protein